MPDTFPTKNWQWPSDAQLAAYRSDNPIAGMSGAAIAAYVDRLRADRDELVAAIESLECDCHCPDDDCSQSRVQAIAARIKAGK